MRNSKCLRNHTRYPMKTILKTVSRFNNFSNCFSNHYNYTYITTFNTYLRSLLHTFFFYFVYKFEKEFHLSAIVHKGKIIFRGLPWGTCLNSPRNSRCPLKWEYPLSLIIPVFSSNGMFPVRVTQVYNDHLAESMSWRGTRILLRQVSAMCPSIIISSITM